MTLDEEYWAPRNCLREPIPELYWAAATLEQAAEAHLAGNGRLAEKLIDQTNTKTIRAYIKSLWGGKRDNPEQQHYLRYRPVPDLPSPAPTAKDRMPSAQERRKIVLRDGFRCRFCGLWVIPPEVRKHLNYEYPAALPWGTREIDQHAAFQALWLQFEHVVPASFGGSSSADNVVISCAGCNYGKGRCHLRELGLTDPRDRQPIPTHWDGLTRVLN